MLASASPCCPRLVSLLVVGAIAAISITGCAGLARWSEAARLIGNVAAPDTAAGPPHPVEVKYQGGGESYVADLYRPEERPRAAMVLVHGFTDLGKADPRLQRFAENLARTRFLVLVPEIESLTRFEVGTRNIAAVRAALAYLARQYDESSGSLGAGAISYSVGPTVIAAVKSHSQVDFVLGVGGYYDLVEAITFATTGYYQKNNEWRYREPGTGGRWLLLLGHAHHMSSPEDRELLREIARAKLRDPDAEVEALRARLSEPAEAAYALVANREPSRVPALIERLPSSMQREIAALDLSRRDLAELDACLVLIHGESDPMIPPTQSVELADAFPEEQVELFVVDGIMHVDVQPGWTDAFFLWRAAVALLEAADEC